MTAQHFDPYQMDSIRQPMPRRQRPVDWFPVLMGAVLVLGVVVVFGLAAQARWFWSGPWL